MANPYGNPDDAPADAAAEGYVPEDELEEIPDDGDEVIDMGDEMDEDDDFNMDPDNEVDVDDDEDGPVTDDATRVFREHNDSVYACDLNPADPDLALSGGGDDRALLWRLSTGEVLFIFAGHTDSVSAVAFSSDGKLAAVGGMDGRVNVWDVATGELSASLEGPDEVVWLKWHPRGNLVLAGSNDGTTWMWGSKGTLMNVYTGHSAPVSAGDFTPDGKHIVTVSEDGSLILWDPKTANRVFRMSIKQSSICHALRPRVAEDGRFHDSAIVSLAISPDGSLALAGSEDNKAALVNLGTGKLISTFENHTEAIEAVGFANGHHLAATGGMDGKLCIWDLNTLRIRHILQHEDGITRVQWHASDPFIYSCSTDKTIRLWDARSGECVRTWRGHRAAILDMSVSKDGQTLLTCGDDGTARVFRY